MFRRYSGLFTAPLLLDPDRRGTANGGATEKEREEAGEKDAQKRLDRARGLIREEVRAALKEQEDAEKRRKDAERAKDPQRPELLRQALEESGRDERTEEELDESRRAENARWGAAVEELAKKTGGRMSAYSYPSHFGGRSRAGIAMGNRPSIIERMQAGDPKPAIRTLNFFRALLTNDVPGLMKWGGRALGESTFGAGGALVPEEFASDVIAKMGELTPFASREFMRVIPMNSDLIRVPVLQTLPVAVFGTEHTAPTGQTEPAWGNVELVAREAILLVPVSEQLIADASVEIISYLIDLFADALARLRNKKVLLGSGSSEPEGVLTNPSINSKSYTTTDAGTKIDSIDSAYFGIPPAYREGAMWVMSDVAQQVIAAIKMTTFEAILTRLTDEPFMRLRGKPVFTTEAIGSAAPTKAIFGNWKFYVFGDRQAMQAKTDNGGDAFRQRQIQVRVIERYDGRVGQPEAFCQLTGIQ